MLYYGGLEPTPQCLRGLPVLNPDFAEEKGDEEGLKGCESKYLPFTVPLTSRKHEEVFKSPLTHGGGRLAGQPLIVIIQNDDLAVGIFLRGR